MCKHPKENIYIFREREMMINAVFAADAEIGSDAVFAADAEIGSDAIFAMESGWPGQRMISFG